MDRKFLLSIAFTDVVQELKPHYSDKKWKDISVAFCFICLLHLANENDLEILPGGDNDAEGDVPTVGTGEDDEKEGVLTKGVNKELLIKSSG